MAIDYTKLDGRTVARIVVGPAAQAVFVKHQSDKVGKFVVRINNSTHEAVPSRATRSFEPSGLL